jgi:hypothetical protein
MSWIKYRLIELPYYDKNGDVLGSIDGRRNEPGKDEFSGGGKVYPLMPGPVLEWKEKAGELLLRLDVQAAEAQTLAAKDEPVTWAESPKTTRVGSTRDFAAAALSDAEADALIREWNPDPKTPPADNEATPTGGEV